MNNKNLAIILDKHASVFRGLRKQKNKQVELVIDETVSPVAQTQRQTPLHLRRKVEDEKYRLERDDVIEKIPEGVSTDLVFPVVVVPKRDDNISSLDCYAQTPRNLTLSQIRNHQQQSVKWEVY